MNEAKEDMPTNNPAPPAQDNSILPIRISAPTTKIGETTDERQGPRSK